MTTQLIFIIIHFVLLIAALLLIRRAQSNEIALVLWVIFITCIPILGPIAAFIVSPGSAVKSE